MIPEQTTPQGIGHTENLHAISLIRRELRNRAESTNMSALFRTGMLSSQHR